MLNDPKIPNTGNNTSDENQDDSLKEDTAQVVPVNLDDDSFGGHNKSVTINVYGNRQPLGSPSHTIGTPQSTTDGVPANGTPQEPADGMRGDGVPQEPLDDDTDSGGAHYDDDEDDDDYPPPLPSPSSSSQLKDGEKYPDRIIYPDYECIAKLAEGGQGAVYQCVKKDTRQVDAIKLLNTTGTQAAFLEENFKMIDKLNHPNICKIRSHTLDWRTTHFLLVMEYIDGVDLSQWRKQFPEGKCPLNELLPIIRQCAEALDWVHGENVVHKDIKPSNIMIERETGRVKLLDFGLADNIDTTMIAKGYRSLGGTPQYMSPEQLKGNLDAINSASRRNVNSSDAMTSVSVGGNLSGRSDQYSLAVTIYSLLTGRLPFGKITRIKDDASDPNQVYYQTRLLKYQTEEWKNIDDVPGVPKYINAALKRALNPNPKHRYATCMDFYRALANEKEAMKVSVGLAASVLGVIAAVAVAVVAGWYLFIRTNPSFKEAKKLVNKLEKRVEESKHRPWSNWEDYENRLWENAALDKRLKKMKTDLEEMSIEEDQVVVQGYDTKIRRNCVKISTALDARDKALTILVDAKKHYDSAKLFKLDEDDVKERYSDIFKDYYYVIGIDWNRIEKLLKEGDEQIIVEDNEDVHVEAYNCDKLNDLTSRLKDNLGKIEQELSAKSQAYGTKLDGMLKTLDDMMLEKLNENVIVGSTDNRKQLEEKCANLLKEKENLVEGLTSNKTNIANFPIKDFKMLLAAENELSETEKSLNSFQSNFSNLNKEIKKYNREADKEKEQIETYKNAAAELLTQCEWFNENVLKGNVTDPQTQALGKAWALRSQLNAPLQSVETSRQLATSFTDTYKTLASEWLLGVKESVTVAQGTLQNMVKMKDFQKYENTTEKAGELLKKIGRIRFPEYHVLTQEKLQDTLKLEKETFTELSKEAASFGIDFNALKATYNAYCAAVEKQNEFAELDKNLREYRNEMTREEKASVGKAISAKTMFNDGNFEEAVEFWKIAIKAYKEFEKQINEKRKNRILVLKESVKTGIQNLKNCIEKAEGLAEQKEIDAANDQCNEAQGLLDKDELTEEELTKLTEAKENLAKHESNLRKILALLKRRNFEKLEEELKPELDEMNDDERAGVAKAKTAQTAFDEGRYEEAEDDWIMAIDAYQSFKGRITPALKDVRVLMATVEASLQEYKTLPVPGETSIERFETWLQDAVNDVNADNLRIGQRKLKETLEKLQRPWTEGWKNRCEELAKRVKDEELEVSAEAQRAIEKARQAAEGAFVEKNYELARASWKKACDEYNRIIDTKPSLKEIDALAEKVEALCNKVGKLPADNEAEKGQGLSFETACNAYQDGLNAKQNDDLRAAKKQFQAALEQLEKLEPIRVKKQEQLDEDARILLGYVEEANTAFDELDAGKLANAIEAIEKKAPNYEKLAGLKAKQGSLLAFLAAQKADTDEKYAELADALKEVNKADFEKQKAEIERLERISRAYKDMVDANDNTVKLEKAVAMLNLKDSKAAKDVRDNCLGALWKAALEADNKEDYARLNGYLETLNDYNYGERNEREKLVNIQRLGSLLTQAENEKNFGKEIFEKANKLLAIKDSALAKRLRKECLGAKWLEAMEAAKNEKYRDLKDCLDTLNKYNYDYQNSRQLWNIQKNGLMLEELDRNRDYSNGTLKKAEEVLKLYAEAGLETKDDSYANGVRVLCWLLELNGLFTDAKTIEDFRKIKEKARNYLRELRNPNSDLEQIVEKCDTKINEMSNPPKPKPPEGGQTVKRVSLGSGSELKLMKVSDELWVAEGRVTGTQYAALLNSVKYRLSKEQQDVFKQLYGSSVKSKASFTWDEAWNWCNLLNIASLQSVPSGWEFRLPTVREWGLFKWKYGMGSDMGEWCLDAVLDKQQTIQFPAPRGFIVSTAKGKRETKPVTRVVMKGADNQLGSGAAYFLLTPRTRENPNQALKLVNGSDKVKGSRITFRVVLAPVVRLQ